MTCSFARLSPRPAESDRKASNPAFTLIELCFVIVIIGLLSALMLSGLARARFQAQVTRCVNHYRQWGVAVNLYASDDSQGRLPAFPFPLAAASKYSELAPWFVAYEMGPKLAEYGVEPPLWFCPARPYGYDRALRFIGALPTGSQTLDLTNLVLYWKTQSPEFAVIEHSWWVPRPLVGSPFSYPDPRVLHSRSEEGWPTRTEDPTGTFQPILTDGVFGVWNDAKTSFDAFGLGHEFPRFPFGRMPNINCLFVDGRVETRPRSALRWQADFGHAAALVY